MHYEPKHMRDDRNRLNDGESPACKPEGTDAGFPSEELPDTVHPMGIPFPDADGEGEYIPMPGDNRVGSFNPNGAIVRNPWAEQPEVKPDYAYTDEQDDMNLLIM